MNSGFNANSEVECDVIVVGAGGSGLAAAVSAAQNGARVLVFERSPQPGGTTGIAVGSFTAAATHLQQSNGIDDSVAWHAEDAGKFAPEAIEARNNESMRAYFLKHAAETLSWLSDMGVNFVGPFPEPPNRTPRMHNVVPCAKSYIATLELELLRHGGRVECGCQVVELLTHETGRINGVRVAGEDAQDDRYARYGVILAGGDYANNPDMIARYKGTNFANIEGINERAIGAGHYLLESIGADLVNMDVTYGPELRFVPSASKPFQQFLPRVGWMARLQGTIASYLPKAIMNRMIKRLLVTWQHPEDKLFDDGAILINSEGARFTNECCSPERELDVANQDGKSAYILLDHRLAKRYSEWPHFISTAPDIAYAYIQDYKRLRPDITNELNAEQLSARFGPRLKETVKAYNAYVTGEAADPFGRTGDESIIDMTQPCFLLGPLKAYFTTTEGGARVNENLQVINQQGDVIPGLYAVGQTGLSGMILWGHGLHIGWAMTSGRLAGEKITEGTDPN